ncbi:NUDIX hydrolase [Ectothiorhodospira variabilis]|uniref:NUDIX hydrolase n=1 Tax=Ectothiorhodospira variabilis TaxID=505694 RepID=UPI001EFA5838|nr:NUDIX hydrolase [Ectothiorhodospira variabilis]MCG5494683.1 NUDIX hydrolase [Ectothiorhodospira variabilis]MCG5498804.1 NUDIX hydrolase [Ectothiorhodospira variabilis]MCG5505095.1 NUDIX hydrolase [Ectothiorhodospira variabilis]MCG5508252.1 NUDIX hydrolase [Ectothiorhodospira variabilis]
MVWTPRVTVASVIEREGRFLLVEEEDNGRRVFNQPAGHLEEGESLLAACIRETLEETGRRLTPEAVVGVYRWQHPASGLTFIRVAVTGSVSEPLPGHALDADILATHWLEPRVLADDPACQRSPLVLRCIEDYLAGRRYPLGLLVEV